MKLVAAWIALLLQAVPSSSPIAQAPRASIEGVVLRVGNDEPIAGAQVTVTSAAASSASIPPVTTDRAGKFTIKDLEAGPYKLTVRSSGYARQEFGQRQTGGPGAPIVLTAGQDLKNIAVRLTPAGNVTGRVRNPKGRPVPGISVQLLRREYDASGRRTFQSVATVRSDDRGEYRFYWMTPGRYYVVAGSPSFGSDGSEGGNANEVVETYLYTFFPGTTDFERAVTIDVRPGAEVDGIDFALTQARQYRIRARVVDPVTGQAPRQAMAAIDYWSPRGGGGIAGAMFYQAQTGTLEFERVTSGIYRISVAIFDDQGMPAASSVRTSPLPSAGATVVVSNSDVDLGVLTLEPPHVITVRTTGDSQPTDSTSKNSVQVILLTPESRSSPMEPFGRPIQAAPQPDGTFTANFPYTSLRVMVSGLAAGFYVREARLDGADALANPVRVPRSSELEIVLSSKAGQLDGIIRDERSQPVAGVPVVLVPDVARSHTERFKQTISDQNGRFSISSIPPGDYKVFGWEALEPYAYFDPDVLQKYEPMGRPVRIVESSRETLDLRMIPVEGQ